MTLFCRSAIRSFFFNHTATTEIYTLSLHDALPISWAGSSLMAAGLQVQIESGSTSAVACLFDGQNFGVLAAFISVKARDRKSTRLNSSHTVISYAVFCLKKKKQQKHKWI